MTATDSHAPPLEAEAAAPRVRWRAVLLAAVAACAACGIVDELAIVALLALIGGLSAAALYVTFSFIGGSLAVLVVGTALIGALVGAEVPLLMTLLQRGRTAGAIDSGRVLANLTAADYLGAVIGG